MVISLPNFVNMEKILARIFSETSTTAGLGYEDGRDMIPCPSCMEVINGLLESKMEQ